MKQDMIEVTDVSVTFGGPDGADKVTALQTTSLTVRRGELLCLIGPSGCGKSTLLNVIGGLAGATEGRVSIEGEAVTGPSPRKIAFVFQENVLFPWQTIIENMETGLRFAGVPKEERTERARRALASVQMLSFANHYPKQLSGGMKQRIQMARALSLDTEIVLMDEPFAALDEQTRLIFGEDLSRLLSETGKTIVFVTHSLVEAVFLADRVAVFTARPGRIKKIIEIDEPHPRTADFMKSAKLSDLRNELYDLLRDEVRKTIEFAEDRVAHA